MKHVGTLLNRTATFALLLCAAAVSTFIQADPTDDFSFTLAHGTAVDTYWLMSEQRVASIFADHLDLFPKSQAPKLARHLMMLCQKYRFDPAFVLSLIQVESRFKLRAHSGVGAVGLMQIMPATAAVVVREMGLPDAEETGILSRRKLEDPFVNLTVGVTYLAWLRDHYQGMPPYYLVAAYNAGPAKIDELISKGAFKPVQTKRYFEAIRRGVPEFRFYKSPRGVEPARGLAKSDV
jgi:soluble lytic murein transglycosylase-like protein